MNRFIELYLLGGETEMDVISILGLTMITFIGLRFLKVENGLIQPRKSEVIVRELSLLILVVAVFIQLLGLFWVMKAIESAGGVPFDLLAGGLYISFIPTLYGFVFFLIGRVAFIYFKFSDQKIIQNQ
ncbi:hypothetical protein [Flammeovirga kamogawensis]|uniref:Uncharacterized protein n=1 Tax=Flammeovirga kamogawensis TaxID=373891 RepID=A0ABX8GTS9_9BACT|nr:hypothetical protein [Flammeovirga kamogawensis]MBB6463312.1 hypothetical protein [Flammeovirga kamogawensis]QWG06713.1 hypothetical protein KM029_15570 [Flammeovirga kamogawensis]TRX68535.1 hypothetical protein EO216_10565 [Flammeovirga kamogawensis]